MLQSELGTPMVTTGKSVAQGRFLIAPVYQ